MTHIPATRVPHPSQVPPPPRGYGAGALVAVAIVGVVVGVIIGVAIARVDRRTAVAAAHAAEPAGGIEVTSTPTDAMVTVDGRLVGITPIERLALAPGRHHLVVDAYGYQPYAGTITVVDGGMASLEAVLAPIGGGARTTGTLSGAGKAEPRAVPATATAAAPGEPEPEPAKKRRRAPRRDCQDEFNDCDWSCTKGETDCKSDCFFDHGHGNAARTACDASCEQIRKACRRQCETAQSRCWDSQ